jgi:uncharacterized protein
MADWNKIDSRGYIDDRRGNPARVAGGIGIGSVALVMLFTYLQTGQIDLSPIVQEVINQQMQAPRTQVDASQFAGADSYEVFASTVLGSTNKTWSGVFEKSNDVYRPPEFVLFRGGTNSACGGAFSEYGPHYCPRDQTVYLDETFFDVLRDRFGATGDVAQAYVIAHEVGHHVQTVRGIELPSIEFELQADCFAGIWANSIKDQGVFESNEIKEALDAAAAVGDDHIQETTTGRVNPESWTHGSSAQRVDAFMRGYTTGSLSSCGV